MVQDFNNLTLEHHRISLHWAPQEVNNNWAFSKLLGVAPKGTDIKCDSTYFSRIAFEMSCNKLETTQTIGPQ